MRDDGASEGEARQDGGAGAHGASGRDRTPVMGGPRDGDGLDHSQHHPEPQAVQGPGIQAVFPTLDPATAFRGSPPPWTLEAAVREATQALVPNPDPGPQAAAGPGGEAFGVYPETRELWANGPPRDEKAVPIRVRHGSVFVLSAPEVTAAELEAERALARTPVERMLRDRVIHGEAFARIELGPNRAPKLDGLEELHGAAELGPVLPTDELWERTYGAGPATAEQIREAFSRVYENPGRMVPAERTVHARREGKSAALAAAVVPPEFNAQALEPFRSSLEGAYIRPYGTPGLGLGPPAEYLPGSPLYPAPRGTFPGDLEREANGHTRHCNARRRWGDGECECGATPTRNPGPHEAFEKQERPRGDRPGWLRRLWRWVRGRCTTCGRELGRAPVGFADWAWGCPRCELGWCGGCLRSDEGQCGGSAWPCPDGRRA